MERFPRSSSKGEANAKPIRQALPSTAFQRFDNGDARKAIRMSPANAANATNALVRSDKRGLVESVARPGTGQNTCAPYHRRPLLRGESHHHRLRRHLAKSVLLGSHRLR